MQPISYSSKSLATAQTNNINSAIKTTIDTWYKNNLIAYTSQLADESFCNDRSISSGTGYKLASHTIYEGYNRLYCDNPIPSLKCTQNINGFKVSNTIAKLDFPIGLILADEMIMAGGKASNDTIKSSNNNYYLYNGQYFWTMTPTLFDSDYSHVNNFVVESAGGLTLWFNVTKSFGVRPVINLKSDILITKGDGLAFSPFVVES